MSSSPLWEDFCEKLKDSGYTLEDLNFCNDDLFTTVVRELNCFTPGQVQSLHDEWLRTVKDTHLGGPASATRPQAHTSNIRVLNEGASFGPDRDNGSKMDSYILPTSSSVLQQAEASSLKGGDPVERSANDIAQRARRVLQACAGQQRRVEVNADNMVLIEHIPSSWRAFKQRADALHGANRPQLLWKLLSPQTLRNMEKAARSGATVHLTSHDDPNPLCPSATVLYTEDAPSLGVPLRDNVVQEGWALAACEVLVGRARSVSEKEVGNLKHYPTGQCFDMLDEAGFDSLEIPTQHALAVFHDEQVLPHYVVYFSLQGRPQQHQQQESRFQEDGLANHLSGRGMPTTASSLLEQQPSRASSVTTCAVHPHKQVEFWSPSEKRLLCSLCLYYDGYSQETCLPIEQAARAEAPRLEKWMSNALTFTKEINGVFDLFDTATNEIQRVREQQESHVKEAFARLHSRLQTIESDLLRQTVTASKQKEQELIASRADITAVVKEVEGLVQKVEEPLNLYRGGSTDSVVCVHLLQLTQRAFGDWEPVRVSPYTIASASIDTFCKDVEAALRQPISFATSAGTQELPEAIDINYLKADCEKS